MLLEHVLLSEERAAAEVWRVRERTEHEAAALFERLAGDLAASGAPAPLIDLAARCAADERDHAVRCRRIVEAPEPGAGALAPDLEVRLGTEATPARRALYASVAIGCVTESLSTAMLIAIRPRVTHPETRDAVEAILGDEVRHARLGWAHVAWAATREEVAWLAEHVPTMLDAALRSEAAGGPAAEIDLRRFGILGRAEPERFAAETIATTIRPGLARFGIATGTRPSR